MDKKDIEEQGLRWDPYILIKGKDIDPFFSNQFVNTKKVLYVLGKGFDIRMTSGIKKLIEESPNLNIDVKLIGFNEGKNSPSIGYKDFVDDNLNKLNKILTDKCKLTNTNINLWERNGRKKRRIGDRQAANIIDSIEEISNYSDVFIDISALPRSIYFSLIGKVLKLIDIYNSKPESKTREINLFIITTENAELDSLIIEKGIDEDLHYPLGFGGYVELESDDLPIVWLPLLGENKVLQFEKANQHIGPSEICPLLPFPSKDPKRSDDIFKEYYSLFFDVLRIEPQNIMYVPEQNPFEVYRKLVNTIKNYNDSLAVLNGCKAVISSFTSKLLSIGALLAAYEYKEDDRFNIGILNVDSQGYEIKNLENIEIINNKSELFVTWLTGKPYLN